MKTTNYFNTFIAVAEDCPAAIGEIPPQKAELKTAANIQFEMLKENPYKHTSDDVLFQVYAVKSKINRQGISEAKKAFFSKGQVCFRASPLPKRYGWGVHSNSQGRIAIFGVESEEYATLAADTDLKQVKAMRS